MGGMGGEGVAAAPLPDVDLRVEWRLQPWNPAPVAAAPSGALVVGTGGLTAPGARVTRTAPPAEARPGLVLRNGGQARWALQRDEPDGGTGWIWTPEGAGLAGGSVRHGRRESLWVQVRWPGGTAPAAVAWRLEQPQADEADGRRGAAAQQAEGESRMPLEQWQPVGRWSRPDGSGEQLQLRLSRLP